MITLTSGWKMTITAAPASALARHFPQGRPGH